MDFAKHWIIILGPMTFIGFRLFDALQQLNQHTVDIRMNEDAVQLLLKQFQNQSIVRRPETYRLREGRIINLRFHKVSYAYDEEPVLNDFSLELLPGQPVVLRGHSGSGKTTAAHIARGLLIPQSGELLVNGIPIQEVSPDLMRRQIGYMTQESYLFHGTLRENILYGHWDKSISDERIWETLTLCSVDKHVRELRGGLDYVLTERGTILSGGEKQRFSLARILLRSPSFLILDEVVANLDPKNKDLVLETIERVTADRLSLMITHETREWPAFYRCYEMTKGKGAVYGIA